MAPSPLQQRRTHNTLLFQKLLNLRDGASPFTLVLDTLEQSGVEVVREFARRAKISKSKIIYISYTTLPPKISFDIDVFISTRRKPLSALRSEIISHLPPPSNTPSPTRYILIIDTLMPLSTTHAPHLSTFLSSLLLTPQVSILATYHLDVPIPCKTYTPHAPSPLSTLLYLSTAILTLSSLSHVLARKRARDRSVQEPVFGLGEGKEGVIFGLRSLVGKGEGDERGIVVNMEIRRRSGRGVVEDFVLAPSSPRPKSSSRTTSNSTSTANLATIMLLDEHPLFAPPEVSATSEPSQEGEEETTFSLNLTEKQKRDRDGIVLPYFDAQKDGGMHGVGEGGRILYEMGAEDREDFDDEEDEI